MRVLYYDSIPYIVHYSLWGRHGERQSWSGGETDTGKEHQKKIYTFTETLMIKTSFKYLSKSMQMY